MNNLSGRDKIYNILTVVIVEHLNVFASLDWMLECSLDELRGGAEANLLVTKAIERFTHDKASYDGYRDDILLMIPDIIEKVNK